jgi:ketosteroid isomerase-like protein
MYRRVLSVALLIVGASGCTGLAVDLEVEGEELMQLSRNWSDLAATGDLDAIMTGWAEDAVMMPPGLPALEGKAAIRNYVEGAMRIPGFQISWEPLSVHVASSGDMAYMIERNVTTLDDSLGNPSSMHGKVVTVWRKGADGSWKNVVDMWNEAPPPGN